MRIGIDATWAGTIGTGTGSYTTGLVDALVRQPGHEYVLYFRRGDEGTNPLYRLSDAHVERRIVDGRGQVGRSLVNLGRSAGRDRLDLFHSPGYFLPLWLGPKVVTIHDVNMFLQWDKWWRPGMRLSWLALCAQTGLSSRLARRIVTDSQYSAGQIERVLRVSRRRVQVLYPGIDERYFSATPQPEVQERFGLSEYLLSVGVLSPQKNLEGIIRAFANLDRPGLTLAIVGREDGPYYDEVIEPLVHGLALSNRVKRLGVISFDDLAALYAGAQAFIYPSFAEGFGLPPLEAMASGTPVVASRATSLPEVLGDAAMLVNPHSLDDVTTAIERVCTDVVLRCSLVERGRRRAAEFRWDLAAREALKIYADAA
jgi:glycosyltransferase involved in cell wall biosynthesis